MPIDGILRQALSDSERQYRSAVTTLQSMYCAGRKESGILLIGLLMTCDDNWEKRMDIVDGLKVVETQACADVLFGELRRVKSSNRTRRYLTTVIRVLSQMPSELVLAGFESLADDKMFSPRMRAKFRAALEEVIAGDDFL